jgi:hypothetical protein
MLRDFGTAGTGRRPRIALARFHRSRPVEAAFVFLKEGHANVAEAERPPTLEVTMSGSLRDPRSDGLR